MLSRLSVAGFRNLANLDLSFDTRFSVFVGPNGAGKTNLLEAVYVAAYLRSFRCSEAERLVRTDASVARIEAESRRHPGDPPERLTVELARTARGARRSVHVEGKRVRRFRDFYGRLKVVLFSPEDLAVLRGGPAARRALIDRAVAAIDGLHLADLADYEKVVRTRNRLLAEAEGRRRIDEALLGAYDQKIATVGGRIWRRRAEWVAAVRPLFAREFEAICGPSSAADLAYVPRLRAPSNPASEAEAAALLAGGLAEARSEDLRRAQTTVGPHRDDIAVTLAGQPAATFASQGQTRALVLALKLAELTLLADAGGVRPTLLLDDVSSELDPTRTARMFEVLRNTVDQCLLSTTDRGLVQIDDAAEVAEYRVLEGCVEPVA